MRPKTQSGRRKSRDSGGGAAGAVLMLLVLCKKAPLSVGVDVELRIPRVECGRRVHITVGILHRVM